jgi:hypothetical protein
MNCYGKEKEKEKENKDNVEHLLSIRLALGYSRINQCFSCYLFAQNRRHSARWLGHLCHYRSILFES